MKNGVRALPVSLMLRLNRLTLLDKKGDKEYRLTWSYRDRYYTITVTDPDTNKPVQNIRIALNETMVLMLIKYMEKLLKAKDDEDVQYGIELRSKDFNNNDSDTLISKGSVVVGKKKGINYLYVTKDNEIKYVFKFLPTRYYIISKDGKDISKTPEVTNVLLSAYIDEFKAIINEIPKFTENDMFEVDLNFRKNGNKKQNKQESKKENTEVEEVSGDDEDFF